MTSLSSFVLEMGDVTLTTDFTTAFDATWSTDTTWSTTLNQSLDISWEVTDGQQSLSPFTSASLSSRNKPGYDTATSSDEIFLPWDNPYNIISRETYQSFENIMICFFSQLIFLVGAPTNIISCVVFKRQGLQERMNLCLFCLALFDLVFVTFFYLVHTHCLVEYVRPDLVQWWKYFTRTYFTGIYRGFLYSSGCLTALISFERCVCVIKPLQFASFIKTRTMGFIIVAFTLVINLAAILYPLQLQIGSRVDPDTGQTMLYLSESEFYAHNRLLYTVVEDSLMMVVIPFINFFVVVVCTVVTVVELKLKLHWRQQSASSDSFHKQLKLVKMLVVVSCIYIATAAPNVALGLTRSLVPEFRHTRRYANIFLASHLLYLMLAMVNSSINFFVYIFMSSRYQAQVSAMLCYKGPRAPNTNTQSCSANTQSEGLVRGIRRAHGNEESVSSCRGDIVHDSLAASHGDICAAARAVFVVPQVEVLKVDLAK